MREFFDADEAAVELQRLTKLEWTTAQVLREAENGNLPICFQHQGKIGVFNRQESELSLSIFRKALRTTYLPRGSYLRVQGHPMLTDVHQKQVSLSPRNLELAKLARGASEVSVTPSETLRIVSESGGFKDTALAALQVPSTAWLFYADDLGMFAQTVSAMPTCDLGEAQKRQENRWRACVDDGLAMPTDTYAQLPRGIGKVAEKLGIRRQSLADDLNAYRNRVFGK